MSPPPRKNSVDVFSYVIYFGGSDGLQNTCYAGIPRHIHCFTTLILYWLGFVTVLSQLATCILIGKVVQEAAASKGINS